LKLADNRRVQIKEVNMDVSTVAIVSIIILGSYGLGYSIFLKRSEQLELSTKNGFWRRQFQLESTPKQKIFDWAFGIVLPVICCLFDPIVFKGAFSHNGALLGSFKPFVYLLSFVSIVLMMLFLLFGSKLKWFNAVLAGFFTIVSTISLTIGVVLFPLSLMGLLFIIGVLGFTPLFAAFAYARNSFIAFNFAKIPLNKTLLWNLVLVSAIFSFAVPYVFNSNVNEILNNIKDGDSTTIRENKNLIWYVSPFVNFDSLTLETCGNSKKELREAVYELTGKNEAEISQQYCTDW
jgi:hypothetical protein